MAADPVAEAIAAARTDERLVLVEGFHALKHALRFGAEIVAAATEDRAALDRLAHRLAPDVRAELAALAVERPLAGLVARAPHTGVVAVARRPRIDAATLLVAAPGPPVVLLEDPRHLGNVGAVVRVAAAAGASAGLHFALPVGRVESAALEPRRFAPHSLEPSCGRPLVVLDPAGDRLAALPDGALLAFGSERDGVSAQLAARADLQVRIPMRAGVSSLNLATAVAVMLYIGRSGFSQRSIVHTGVMPTDS
jgi:RNA methyltransferase, TrmH family